MVGLAAGQHWLLRPSLNTVQGEAMRTRQLSKLPMNSKVCPYCEHPNRDAEHLLVTCPATGVHESVEDALKDPVGVITHLLNVGDLNPEVRYLRGLQKMKPKQ